MKNIYPKITVRKDEMYDKEMEFLLQDYPDEITHLDEYAEMLYDSSKDEAIIKLASRMEFDACGHYSRPDVLSLEIHE